MIYSRDFARGIVLYLFCSIFIAIYMVVLYFISHNFIKEQASGSLIYDQQGQLRGSVLLAQHVESDRYFKGRINSRFDSKCDVAMYSELFRNAINSRYAAADNKDDVIMITPSNSLLDPYISRNEALRQASKIAAARAIPLDLVIALIDELTLYASFPFFQLDIVNTTMLNARLDFGVLNAN